MAAHHDDGHGQQITARPFLEQGDAIGIGHPDIEQHQVVGGLQARLTCLGRILGQIDRMPFIIEDFGEQLADAMLVVDHQNVCHCCALSVFVQIRLWFQ